MGGTGSTADHPFALTEGANDMFPLGVLEGRETIRGSDRVAVGSLFQFGKRNLQLSTARKNNRAFDKIFQLADVAGPGIFRAARPSP